MPFPITDKLNDLMFVMQDEQGCLFRATPEMISKYICAICEDDEGITSSKSCFTYNNLSSCGSIGEMYALNTSQTSPSPILLNDISNFVIDKTNGLYLNIEDWLQAGQSYPINWYIYNSLDINNFAIIEVISVVDLINCPTKVVIEVNVALSNGSFQNGNNICAYVYTNSLEIVNAGGGIPIYKGIVSNQHVFKTIETETPQFVEFNVVNDKININVNPDGNGQGGLTKNIYTTNGTLTSSRTLLGDNKSLRFGNDTPTQNLSSFETFANSYMYHKVEGTAGTWGIGKSVVSQNVNYTEVSYENDLYRYRLYADLNNNIFIQAYNKISNTTESEIKLSNKVDIFALNNINCTSNELRQITPINGLNLNKNSYPTFQQIVNREIGLVREWTHPLDPNTTYGDYTPIPAGWRLILPDGYTPSAPLFPFQIQAYSGNGNQLISNAYVNEDNEVDCTDQFGNTKSLIVPKISGNTFVGHNALAPTLFNSNRNTFGSITNTLNEANIPEHRHRVASSSDGAGNNHLDFNLFLERSYSGVGNTGYELTASQFQPDSFWTGNAGASPQNIQPISNIQPSIVTYYIFCVGIN